MKVFKRTYLPDVINYNHSCYMIDINLSFDLAQGKLKENKDLIQVNVLSTRLKHKLNLHHKPYTASKWIFKKQ